MQNVLIAFGSPSDYTALQTHFERLPDTQYHLSVASAHRTPELVSRHAKAAHYDGIIAGAGMCNALKDAYLRECEGAVLVALPVHDSRTGGLSSILSSSEMPPGYPVAMSQMNNLGAAVNFMNYALGGFRKARLACDGETDSRKAFDDAAGMFGELGVEVVDAPADDAIDVAVYASPYFLDDFKHCIATFASPLRSDLILRNYLNSLRNRPEAMHTGVADGKNLALYASMIIARGNPEVRERIMAQRNAGKAKYAPFEELRQI